MRVAEELGKRSRCSRGKIGCVIVAPDNRPVTMSYVGPPPRFEPANFPNNQNSCVNWCPRSQPEHEPQPGYVDCVSSHAEMNALARADYSMMAGGTAYVNGAVCWMCAKALCAAGISRVVMKVHESDAHREPSRTVLFFEMNHVSVTVIPS